MKNFKKIISVILAVIMAASCLSTLAFAAPVDDDIDYDSYVDGWKANYQLFIDQLFDNEAYTSWNYVNIYKQSMKDTMNTWTALALYDDAWRNGVFHEIDIDKAELLILALIERADFYGGIYEATGTESDAFVNRLCFEYADKIKKVLDLAQDANDLIQKVEEVLKWEEFSNVVKSEEWGKVFEVIGYAQKIASAYEVYRGDFIELYSRVLSVQLANEYYIDLVEYIAANAEDANLRKAADNVIGYMTMSLTKAIDKILQKFVNDKAIETTEILVDLALNSNVYTATVYEWVQTAHSAVVSVADFLWNTNETYPHLSQLYTSFEFQTLAADWAYDSYYNVEEDAEKSYFTIDLLHTTRKVCEQSLINYKESDNKGAVGAITNKLHKALYEDTTVSLEALNIMKTLMFETAPENFKKVTDTFFVYCPVSIDFLDKDFNEVYTLVDGKEVNDSNALGIFKSIYSEYNKEYLKIAILFDTDTVNTVKLNGTAGGYVTLIHKELLDDNTVEDWSFTDVQVDNKTKITFSLEYNDAPVYNYQFSGGAVTKPAFNDVFKPSQYPEYTAKDVVDAGTELGKEEVKSIWDQIVEFFEKIGQWFKDLFGIKD